jgi:hypothetical protein
VAASYLSPDPTLKAVSAGMTGVSATTLVDRPLIDRKGAAAKHLVTAIVSKSLSLKSDHTEAHSE